MTVNKKKGRALVTFNDAGTGESFEANKVYLFRPGAFRNYRAAGLVKPSRARSTRATAAN